MSVFYDNRGRDGGHASRGSSSDARARWGAFGSHRQTPPRRRPQLETPLWGLSFERAEGLIQLALAFALVGGVAAVIHSTLLGVEPAQPPVQAAALPEPLPPPALADQAPAAPAPSVVAPDAPLASVQAAAPVQAAPAPEASSPAADALAAPSPSAAELTASVPASLFDGRPIAGRTEADLEATPRPLAPPSAEIREKLAAQDDASAPREVAMAYAEQTEAAPSVREEPATSADGRPTKCYLKLGGRSHENGDCRIRQSDEKVVFQFADKSLTLVHERGRAWMATLDGRRIGRVYRNARKPCWGARGFFACDNT